LKAYDYRNGAHRAAMTSLEADPGYRARRAGDPVWPPQARAYGGPVEKFWALAAGPLGMAAQLIMPVLMLVTLLGAAYLYSDAILILPGAPRRVQNALLAASDLVLPAAWLAIHLCNRRYGAAHAFAQLLAALVILILVALINPWNLDNWSNNSPALSGRAMLAFGAAFLLANFIAITIFDAARGPRWWTAPFAASCAASLVFSAIYYPAAFAGGGEVGSWTDCAMVHFAVFFTESLLLLLPYWLLRPAMRPLGGMNGY
jgi:uncharacterized PurR-regulated membrane protein YhhQ (DUF165 family)